MEKLRNLSLKNKIFFSTLAVILLISLVIALFTRWILISSLTSELERRGLGIAYNIIENALYFSPEDHQGLERVYYTHIQDGKIQIMGE